MYCEDCEQKVEQEAKYDEDTHTVTLRYTCSCKAVKQKVCAEKLVSCAPDSWDW